MPRWSRSAEAGFGPDDRERGSAALEFILVGMVLLVPIVYLVVTLGIIQAQSLGAEAGARHIARAVAMADDAADADARIDLVLAAVVEEYGLEPTAVGVELACTPTGPTCPAAGATLVVTVRTEATLPLVPPVLGLDRAARIPIEASAAQRVSRAWGSR